MKRIEATVHGRVQGVSFRYYTHLEARRLGLAGWVANHPNGTVKVVAEGTQEALDQLVDFLHRGPSAARVNKVDVSWIDATHEFNGFSVRYI